MDHTPQGRCAQSWGMRQAARRQGAAFHSTDEDRGGFSNRVELEKKNSHIPITFTVTVFKKGRERGKSQMSNCHLSSCQVSRCLSEAMGRHGKRQTNGASEANPCECHVASAACPGPPQTDKYLKQEAAWARGACHLVLTHRSTGVPGAPHRPRAWQGSWDRHSSVPKMSISRTKRLCLHRHRAAEPRGAPQYTALRCLLVHPVWDPGEAAL